MTVIKIGAGDYNAAELMLEHLVPFNDDPGKQIGTMIEVAGNVLLNQIVRLDLDQDEARELVTTYHLALNQAIQGLGKQLANLDRNLNTEH